MTTNITKVLLILLYYLNLHEAAKTRRDIEDDIWGDDNQFSTTESAPPNVTSRNPDLESTTTSETCTCVSYYLCKDTGTIITDGEGLLDIRLGSGCDGSYLNKCCKIDDSVVDPSPTPPVEPKGCGFRNTNGVGFKIKNPSNNEAEFGEFPWMIAVLNQTNGEYTYQCGGALLHPQVILTAAHCVKDKGRLKIRAGEWDTQTTKEQYPFQDVDVASVTIHPEYNQPKGLINDIALLFLEKPVELSPHINVICLPPPNVVVDKVRCYSSGWGRKDFGNNEAYQVILKKIDLPMVSRNRCQNYLRETRLGKLFKLHPSFVCAGGEGGKDTCTGDGGSPLVCPIEGHEERYFQVGIVAWGIGCGGERVPGVYVNVALFRNWIDKQLQEKNLETSVYMYS